MASSSSVSNDPEEESIISYYFSRGYTYEVITEFLAKFHGITMCVRTLKNRLRQLKLRRRMPYFDMDVVREQIEGLWAKTSSWFYGTIKFYCSIKPGGRFCPEPFNYE